MPITVRKGDCAIKCDDSFAVNAVQRASVDVYVLKVLNEQKSPVTLGELDRLMYLRKDSPLKTAIRSLKRLVESGRVKKIATYGKSGKIRVATYEAIDNGGD